MSAAAPEPFRADGDWAELCTCFSGVPAEYELTPVQFAVADRLLGLSKGGYSDDYLVGTALPAVISAMRDLERG